MFYQPEGKPYEMTTAVYRFVEPKRRHHNMRVAYAEGGEVIADATKGLTGYTWKAYADINSRVYVGREDSGNPVYIFQGDDITQVDLTFDQNMRPFIAYVDKGRANYYHFSRATSSYARVPLPIGWTFPRCELDMRDTKDIPNSDIILGYIRGDKLCFGIQRERYLTERVVATDPKKSMLWRVGKTVDGRFAFQWR